MANAHVDEKKEMTVQMNPMNNISNIVNRRESVFRDRITKASLTNIDLDVVSKLANESKQLMHNQFTNNEFSVIILLVSIASKYADHEKSKDDKSIYIEKFVLHNVKKILDKIQKEFEIPDYIRGATENVLLGQPQQPDTEMGKLVIQSIIMLAKNPDLVPLSKNVRESATANSNTNQKEIKTENDQEKKKQKNCFGF